MSLLPTPRRSSANTAAADSAASSRWPRTAGGLVVGALIAAVLTTVGLAGAADASTVLKLDMQSLVANSQQIVDGRVQRVQAKVEDGKVYTYTTISVTDGLKGIGDAKTVTVKQVGGRTDTLATWVPGIPSFQRGERVVVFLEKLSDDALPVVTGMSQGKFKVALGPGQTTPYVVPYLGNLGLVEAGKLTDDLAQSQQDQSRTAARFKTAQPAKLYTRVVALDAFKQRVRRTIRAQEDDK